MEFEARGPRTPGRSGGTARRFVVRASVTLVVLLGLTMAAIYLRTRTAAPDIHPAPGRATAAQGNGPIAAQAWTKSSLTQPQLQGVDASVLSRLGVSLQSPDGHGATDVTGDRAISNALSERAGWSLLGQPVLAWINQPTYHRAPTCLCWVVHLQSPQPLPAHGPPGSPESLGSTVLQFIDAQTGQPTFVVAGGGLG